MTTRGKYTRKEGGTYGRKPDAEQDAAVIMAVSDLTAMGQRPTPQAVCNVMASRGIEKTRTAIARRMERLKRDGKL